MRLDQYIATNFGYTRNRAQFLIDEKLVKVNGKLATKNSLQIEEWDIVEIQDDKRTNYVARSALKLDAFLEETEIVIKDKICVDVWASTGWFTQVLLERWAKEVYAVDVWSSQLHEKVKAESRVISLENQDIRNLDKDIIKWKVDFIVVDVSFISLSKVIDSLIVISDSWTEMILLYKPQFEVGRKNLKKSWIPINKQVITQSLDKFKKLCKEKNLKITKISESKLPGEAGNIEFFIYLHNSAGFSDWIQKS
ncbi:MAG: Hemolysin A [uncultured bacterium (gcode 4)]|uniref:Hemolysin A n=1 Tax=uncultured bacterium (gcode 4) TaxID=1234023 RepID=K2FXY8_9BACT|nr:MAG: Hemolysin A [uncultured bacterium (gcode 4)]